MSITGRVKIVCQRAGYAAALAAAAVLVALSGGCDLGGRDHGAGADGGDDAGVDVGDDASVDSGPTGSDAGEDASFRDEDAGDTWVDEPVVIPGPCDDDCAYTYNFLPREDGNPYTTDLYGRASFEIAPGSADGLVSAREAHKAAVLFSDQSSRGYRQRAVINLVLTSGDHDLVSGDALVYNMTCGSLYNYGTPTAQITKRYEFSYDSTAGELSYSVAAGDRMWSRTLDAPEPPIVVLNHREYPYESWGMHSPLTAMLLAERYDWGAGGAQRVPIFSPEMERIDAVELEAGAADDTLVLRFPVDSAKAPWESWTLADTVYPTNEVTISLTYDVPSAMTSRSDLEWLPAYTVPVELNLENPSADEETTAFPTVPESGSEITATSGAFTLHGIVDAPDSMGARPAVVMLPGWDYMTRRGEVGAVDLYAQLAELVTENGFVAARFDARGAGDNGVAFSEATVADLVDDAEAAIAAVRALPSVDPDRVFLLTTGAGAHVAAGVAEAGAVPLAGIILVAPIGGDYAEAAAAINERYLTNAGTSSGYLTAAQTALAAVLGSLDDGTYGDTAYLGHTVAAWQSLFGLDLVANPVALPPTLILYGTEDHLVPQTLVDDLAAALAGEGGADGGVELADGGVIDDVTTAILPGLTHALTAGTALGLWPEHGGAESIDVTAASAISNWLDGIAGGL